MTSLRLWSDEIEAMRPEAREVIATGFAAFAEMLGRDRTPPSDQHRMAGDDPRLVHPRARRLTCG